MSEAGQCILVLESLGKTLDNVRHWLWMALGILFGDKKDQQFVVASAGTGCVHGKNQAMHQVWLLPTLSSGAGQ